MKLTPYPEYKDSGVPWLGQVPKHWEVLPHRALFKEIKEQGHDTEPLLSVTISKGLIRQSDLLTDSSKKDSSNLDKAKYKLVVPGDIAYNKMRAWQGAVGSSRFRGIVSPAYVVVRLRRPDSPDYFHFLFRTPGFAKEAERWSYGITSDMWSLRPEHFKMIYSCVAPRPEQDAIVNFLRQLEIKVSRYIRNRRRLIEVLNEQKQAIINRAVTRGLDPNVRMKPSGIEWLGDIPEHWSMTTFGRFLQRIEQGWSPVAAEGEILENQWSVLTLSCMSKGKFYSDAIKPIPVDAYVHDRMMIYDGDILISRSNTPELVGDCCIVDAPKDRTIICDLIYRLKMITSKIDSNFTLFFLLSPFTRHQIRMDARGSSSTMVKLSHGHIRRWKIAVPPVKEQVQIAEHIMATKYPIELAIDRAKKEIQLIQEYRTRLIANVVTGKVDVRGIAIQLPEEELQKESLDFSVELEEDSAYEDAELGDDMEDE